MVRTCLPLLAFVGTCVNAAVLFADHNYVDHFPEDYASSLSTVAAAQAARNLAIFVGKTSTTTSSTSFTLDNHARVTISRGGGGAAPLLHRPRIIVTDAAAKGLVCLPRGSVRLSGAGYQAAESGRLSAGGGGEQGKAHVIAAAVGQGQGITVTVNDGATSASASAEHGATASAGHGASASAGHGASASTGHGASASTGHGASASASHGASASTSHGASTSTGHGASASVEHGVSVSVGHGVSASAGHSVSSSVGHDISATAGHGDSVSAHHGTSLFTSDSHELTSAGSDEVSSSSTYDTPSATEHQHVSEHVDYSSHDEKSSSDVHSSAESEPLTQYDVVSGGLHESAEHELSASSSESAFDAHHGQGADIPPGDLLDDHSSSTSTSDDNVSAASGSGTSATSGDVYISVDEVSTVSGEGHASAGVDSGAYAAADSSHAHVDTNGVSASIGTHASAGHGSHASAGSGGVSASAGGIHVSAGHGAHTSAGSGGASASAGGVHVSAGHGAHASAGSGGASASAGGIHVSAGHGAHTSAGSGGVSASAGGIHVSAGHGAHASAGSGGASASAGGIHVSAGHGAHASASSGGVSASAGGAHASASGAHASVGDGVDASVGSEGVSASAGGVHVSTGSGAVSAASSDGHSVVSDSDHAVSESTDSSSSSSSSSSLISKVTSASTSDDYHSSTSHTGSSSSGAGGGGGYAFSSGSGASSSSSVSADGEVSLHVSGSGAQAAALGADGVSVTLSGDGHYTAVDESNCECVPAYLCDEEGYINAFGSDLIDVRSFVAGGPVARARASRCGADETCCRYRDGEERTPIGWLPDTCGTRSPVRLDRRVVTGEASRLGEFPWMVALLLEVPASETSPAHQEYICGGSLIAEDVVLTGAHCVKEHQHARLTARVGEWDTSSRDSVYPHQDLAVAKVVYHPKFHAQTLFNDVALLQLATPAELAPHVNTLCLPPVDDYHIDYSDCVAAGWGQQSFDDSIYSNILKKVPLSKVDPGQCERRMRQTRLGRWFRLHKTFLCAGGLPKVDTCKGDGGAPLACRDRSEPDRQKYVQIGIVAWGINCGRGGFPGVYADLIKLLPWVQQQLPLVSNYADDLRIRGLF